MTVLKWIKDSKMRYFDTLPKIVVTQNNVSKLYTNLLARANIIQNLLNDTLLFYTYDIKDSDTPEIIAHKYYNDINRFWIVLFANQILDPQWEWPMTNVVFNQYLLNKYTESQLGEAHHYEKIVTTIDNETQTTSIKTVEVDYDTYVSIVPFSTTKTFPDRTSVVYSISTKAVSIYEYENVLNESKRNIKLINSSYATDMETQYQTLVKS